MEILEGYLSGRELTKTHVVAGIILDRNFDVPVSVLEELTNYSICCVLDKLAHDNHRGFIAEYARNIQMQSFFAHIREGLPPREHNAVVEKWLNKIDAICAETGSIIRILTYNDVDWEREKIKIKRDRSDVHKKFVFGLLRQALRVPELEDWWILIYNALPRNFERVGLEYHDAIIFLRNVVPLESLVKLAYMTGANLSYQRTKKYQIMGIPVLYHEYDPVDIMEYIGVVLTSGYAGRLDNRLENYLVRLKNDPTFDTTTAVDLEFGLLEIGNSLNQDNLKYRYIFTGKKEKTTSTIMQFLTTTQLSVNVMKYHLSPAGWMKDFGTLIHIMGYNPAGFPLPIQTLFLERHGDIETMFDENGNLRPEASILRSKDQIINVIDRITPNDLRFLLLNCPEFVKSIMLSGDLTTAHYIHIARTLLVNPIDEELWSLLNDVTGARDYRVYLLQKIISTLTTNALFDNVPTALMYFEPSVLYLTRNLRQDMFPFVPVHKAALYLKQHIARNGYTRLNLFCNGEYVTISSALGDSAFIVMDAIVKDKKYGYICDLTNDQADIPGIIENIVDLIEERQVE